MYTMCDKSCKFNGKQLCLDSTCCLPHQVTSENSSNNIGENSKDLESLAYHQHVKSNTSFLHAVINMIGMLIGQLFPLTFYNTSDRRLTFSHKIFSLLKNEKDS